MFEHRIIFMNTIIKPEKTMAIGESFLRLRLMEILYRVAHYTPQKRASITLKALKVFLVKVTSLKFIFKKS